MTIHELTPSAIFHVHKEKVSPRSSVQWPFYHWCKATWNWPISFTKSLVFPGVQDLRKPNLPHFPHLQGKMIIQTPWKSLYKVVFARGPPPGEGRWQMHKHQKTPCLPSFNFYCRTSGKEPQFGLNYLYIGHFCGKLYLF